MNSTDAARREQARRWNLTYALAWAIDRALGSPDDGDAALALSRWLIARMLRDDAAERALSRRRAGIAKALDAGGDA